MEMRYISILFRAPIDEWKRFDKKGKKKKNMITEITLVGFNSIVFMLRMEKHLSKTTTNSIEMDLITATAQVIYVPILFFICSLLRQSDTMTEK